MRRGKGKKNSLEVIFASAFPFRPMEFYALVDYPMGRDICGTSWKRVYVLPCLSDYYVEM